MVPTKVGGPFSFLGHVNDIGWGETTATLVPSRVRNERCIRRRRHASWAKVQRKVGVVKELGKVDVQIGVATGLTSNSFFLSWQAMFYHPPPEQLLWLFVLSGLLSLDPH